MKLTTEQIASFMAGVDHVEVIDGGCRPHRLPAGVHDLYAGGDELKARADCTTCVRLRFASDSKRIRLRLRFGTPARWYFLSAMMVDGERVDAFGPVSRQETWEGVIFEQEKRKRHVFDIWLPHLCPADVMGVELDDGCSAEAAPAFKRRWLAYGDSITQGMNASLPIFTWTAKVALALDADVVNFGVGGATARRELANAVPESEFDMITVSYGANDWNTSVPLNVFRDNLASLADAIRQHFPSQPVIFITPIPFFRATRPNDAGAILDDFRGTIEKTIHGRAGMHVIKGTDLVPHDCGFFNDWSHPNDRGMLEYATNLLSKLTIILK